MTEQVRGIAWLLVCAIYSGLMSILIGKATARTAPLALLIVMLVWAALMALLSVALGTWLFLLWLAAQGATP